MTRAISTTIGRRAIFKKKKRVVTKIDNIPNELISEVLARVASDSFTDMFNAKLSCKTFHQVAEDTHIYKHVSLDNFPIIAWEPLSEMQQAFLSKCEESENPNLVFRQAMVDYFGGKQLDPGLTIKKLDKAVKSGHIGAIYLRCILMIFSGDNELKERGIESLVSIKKCEKYRRELRSYRNELMRILKMIWVENPILERRPICCTMRVEHMKERPWVNIDDEDIYCQACNIDEEISLISGYSSHL